MAPVFVPLRMKSVILKHLRIKLSPDPTWVKEGLRDLKPVHSEVIVISVRKLVLNLDKIGSLVRITIRSNLRY